MLSRAEGLRGGFIGASDGTSETGTESPADTAAAASAAAGDGGSGRRRGLLPNGAPRSAAAPGVPADGQDSRRHDGRGLTSTASRRKEELELLRQAVRMEDALGYDEPPALPVPTRLYLAAALLRGNGGGGGGDDDASGGDTSVNGRGAGTLTTTAAAVGKDEAEEAETVLRELEVRYPNMGRTLLGLWRACSALGKHDEALEFRERFLASWQYSEVWLADSAHVGSVGVEGQANADGDGEPEGDFNRGGGGGRGGSTVSSGPELGEEEDHEKVDRESGMVTTATVVLAAIAVAALSLVAAVAVAARRKTRTRGCCSGSFSELPWGRHLVGAVKTEEKTNVAQTQTRQWRGLGSARNGYRTIGE